MKKSHFLALSAIMSVCVTRVAAAGCESDAQCKGDRICVDGSCVSPDAPAPAEPAAAEPASEATSPEETAQSDASPPAAAPPMDTATDASAMPPSEQVASIGYGHPQGQPPHNGPAADPVRDQGTYAPPTQETGSAVRVHDGFYLRLALGGAYGKDSVEAEDFKFDGSGPGVAEEIAIGTTVAPGLVIGGGVYAAMLVEPEGDNLEYGGEDLDGVEASWDSATFGVVGPFLDYYPNPAGGFHLQGAVGIASLSVSDGKMKDGSNTIDLDESDGTGFGAMLGIGYEAWVGDQWSLGVLGRVLYGTPTMEDNLPGGNTEVDWDHKMLIPGVLMSATYH